MAKTNNHDVLGLCKRLKRFATEMNKSASSSVAEFRQADRARLMSYYNALQAYKAWVVAQPELDLPESHPREFEVDDSPNFNLADAENEMVDDCIHQLSTLNYELVHSQSSRLGAGLNQFDAGRFDAIMQKALNYLTEYVDNATPLDLPESSPQTKSTGPGRTGINP